MSELAHAAVCRRSRQRLMGSLKSEPPLNTCHRQSALVTSAQVHCLCCLNAMQSNTCRAQPPATLSSTQVCKKCCPRNGKAHAGLPITLKGCRVA